MPKFFAESLECMMHVACKYFTIPKWCFLQLSPPQAAPLNGQLGE